MPSRKKIRTIYLIVAAATELLIGFAAAVHLKIDSLSFFLVLVTALIATGSIEHFVLNHDTDLIE